MLDIVPRPSGLCWLHDVFDNSVAIATFDEAASELRFESAVTLEQIQTLLPDYALEIEAHTYPFIIRMTNGLISSAPWRASIPATTSDRGRRASCHRPD